MPDDPGLFAMLGVKVPNMFAGLAGGIVGAWVTRAAGVATILGYIVCGALTANFLASPALHILPDWVGEGGAGFIIGLGAMAICASILGAIAKWTPSIGGKAP